MSENEAETGMIFEVLKAAVTDGVGARIGRLALPGRNAMQTPNFVGVATRGAVPHLTPDNVSKYQLYGGSYIALEDFIEKSQTDPLRQPPIYQIPSSPNRRPLHAFTALPQEIISILAPRRHPAAVSKMGNGGDWISVFPAAGFQHLTTDEYAATLATLKPDLAVPMADLTFAIGHPSSKRAVRMVERTEDWMAQLLAPEQADKLHDTAIFAPTLPVPYATQWAYLNSLAENASSLSGLTIYDAALLPDLADYPSLTPLPRLSLSPAHTPQDILRDIARGADIFALPFLTATSEAGVALSFTFPAPTTESTTPLPLGTDLSQPTHQTSLRPLSQGCACYTCTAHHAAYVHHLLAAREMLGWTLLQMHNHAVLRAFFAGVREALQEGRFAAELDAFVHVYEAEMPVGEAEKPRMRGYQVKSAGGATVGGKLNRPGWGKLGGGVATPTEGRTDNPQTAVGVGGNPDGHGIGEVDERTGKRQKLDAQD